MHKDKSNQQKRKEHTPEKQSGATSSVAEENQNQGNNTKKVSLGVNTKHQ